MKKSFWIVVLVLILCFFLVFLFANKEQIIKNLKYSINIKANNEEMSEEETVVDITDLNANELIEHEHVYKTMYDENEHWNECMICGQKNEIVNHSFITTWANGVESCYPYNSYTRTCKCGYSEIGHKPCVWDGRTYFQFPNIYSHGKKCKVCGEIISYKYYLQTYGSGSLYDGNPWERCGFSNGNKIVCGSSGTCNQCKFYYSNPQNHSLDVNNDDVIFCNVCNRTFGVYSEKIEVSETVPTTYTIISEMQLKNGAVFSGVKGINLDSNNVSQNTQTIIEGGIGGTSVKLRTIFTLKDNIKESIGSRIAFDTKINGVGSSFFGPYSYFYPDLIKPTISSLSNIDGINVTEWSKTKTIIVEGTENWCNTVKVKIVDIENEDNIIFEGETAVSNNKYSISCTPELEAGEQEKKYKVIVTDACENSVEEEFYIAKVDAIPPEILSIDAVDNCWAKEKKIDFIATDNGIGNVSIAFNDIEDLKSANLNKNNQYLRNYKFIGDIYEPKEFPVLYRDGLGNTTIKKIIIDKIDNTAPTIIGVSFCNNSINIQANDRHITLGEGSGVSKYRFLKSTIKLENPDITQENSVEVLVNENIIIPDIATVKYIYIVAEDMVRKY